MSGSNDGAGDGDRGFEATIPTGPGLEKVARRRSPHSPGNDGAQMRLDRHPLIEYHGAMSILLRNIARFVAQKAASDPRAKEVATRAAQTALEEAKRIARDDDKARAAGRAFRRALNTIQKD